MPPASYTVRAAKDSEARACRILLPALFRSHEAPDLLVAVGADGRLAGAAALGTVHGMTPGQREGFPLDVHVISAHRRRGAGRLLVEAAAVRCRGRTPALTALQAVAVGSGEDCFLRACGFDEYDQIRHFEVDGPPFYADMAALAQRLAKAGRVPATAQVVRLENAPLDHVAIFIARYFGAPPDLVRRQLRPGAADSFDLHHSAALLIDGVVRGVLAYRWNDGLPIIEVRAIDPALRGGWANALLLERATGHAIATGATRFRFFADERLADTMSLARRARATEIAVERHYRRTLATAPSVMPGLVPGIHAAPHAQAAKPDGLAREPQPRGRESRGP